MITINKIRFLVTLIIAATGLQVIDAQKNYNLISEESLIQITGTSTVHDWEMKVEDPEGKVVFAMNRDILAGIQNLQVIIGSGNIKSDYRIMDNKTRNALSAGKYPEIKFKLNDVKDFRAEGSEISGKVTGTLFVAGVTRVISLPFSGVSQGKGIKIYGEKKLNMSDFNIEPPTALLGALKTGDAIKINFVTTWKKSGEVSASLKD